MGRSLIKNMQQAFGLMLADRYSKHMEITSLVGYRLYVPHFT